MDATQLAVQVLAYSIGVFCPLLWLVLLLHFTARNARKGFTPEQYRQFVQYLEERRHV